MILLLCKPCYHGNKSIYITLHSEIRWSSYLVYLFIWAIKIHKWSCCYVTMATRAYINNFAFWSQMKFILFIRATKVHKWSCCYGNLGTLLQSGWCSYLLYLFLRATKIRHKEVNPGSRLCGGQSLLEHCCTNKSLSNPQIFHQILLYMHCTVRCDGHTLQQREVKHGLCRAEG